MKAVMKRLSIFFLVGFIFSVIIYINSHSEMFFSLAITFGTFSYHFLMRLLVGGIINAMYHNHMDYKRKWFQSKQWEAKLYKKLKVKSWKDRMPTYDADTFSLELHSMEEIVMAMCQSEVVHETIAVFSFVPIAFTIWFDSFGVFLITSIMAAGFDMMFVIMQRYNRPRLVKIVDREKNRKSVKEK